MVFAGIVAIGLQKPIPFRVPFAWKQVYRILVGVDESLEGRCRIPLVGTRSGGPVENDIRPVARAGRCSTLRRIVAFSEFTMVELILNIGDVRNPANTQR